MNCLIIVGPSSTGRRESEVEIRIRTYSDSITSVHRGAGRIEDYTSLPLDVSRLPQIFRHLLPLAQTKLPISR